MLSQSGVLFISLVSHFALSVDGECFVCINSLKDPEEIPRAFCPTFPAHGMCIVFIARLCCLTQNESIFVFYFIFSVVLSN